MNPLLRLLRAAASHGLLTGQIVFSAAFVGACELPNWIHAPRQVNACRSRSTALALFFPSGMLTAVARNQPALAPGRRGCSDEQLHSIPASAYVEHFDPELPHHRAWLQAVLERLVAHDPKAVEEGRTLSRLWTEHQQSASSETQSQQPRTRRPLSEASSAVPTSTEAPRGNPLSVPWFSQLDSRTDQARRMCFSSSCAMLLASLRPGVLSGANGDDQYLERVRRYGDTTDTAAQLQALASYGIEAEFTKQASFRTIEAQIAAGIPVPCGYLHRGPLEKPAGGGHWLIVVGHTPTHLIVHDPL